MRSSKFTRVMALLLGLAAATSLSSCGSSSTTRVFVISGTVSGSVNQGVTMTLGGASIATTTTDAAGSYAFTGLADGAYTVTPSLSGHSFAPTSRPVTVSSADVRGQDFTATDAMAGTFAVTGHMTVGRDSHTATPLANGKVLVVGGEGQSAELYDPATGTFTATGNTIAARRNHTATRLLNGKVLVAGGYLVVASAELYDPATGTFTATGSMTTPRMVHTATLLPGGKVLVAGGSAGTSIAASAELYDPAAGTFAATGSLATGRAQHTATLLPDGTVLVAGGYGSLPPEASAELYDPNTGTFAATGSMIGARFDHTATLLPGGKVLVAAGRVDGMGLVPLASAELYDPAARTFSATGSLGQGRSRPEATLLLGGRVLVTGGGSGYVPSPGPAELYDAGTGAFTPTGTMLTNRHGHTASLLPSGRVLVTGGYDGSSVLSSAELYRP